MASWIVSIESLEIDHSLVTSRCVAFLRFISTPGVVPASSHGLFHVYQIPHQVWARLGKGWTIDRLDTNETIKMRSFVGDFTTPLYSFGTSIISHKLLISY